MPLLKWPSAIQVIRAVVVLGLLIAPWPGLARLASGAFTDVAQVVVAPLLRTSKFDIGFTRAPSGVAEGDWDTVVLVKNPKTGRILDNASLDVRRVWYLPSAVFVALCIGFPRGGRRGVGLLLAIGLFILPVLSLLPLLSFLGQDQVIQLGSVVQSALAIGYRALVAPLGMAYAIPAFLWLAMAELLRAVPALAPKQQPLS